MGGGQTTSRRSSRAAALMSALRACLMAAAGSGCAAPCRHGVRAPPPHTHTHVVSQRLACSRVGHRDQPGRFRVAQGGGSVQVDEGWVGLAGWEGGAYLEGGAGLRGALGPPRRGGGLRGSKQASRVSLDSSEGPGIGRARASGVRKNARGRRERKRHAHYIHVGRMQCRGKCWLRSAHLDALGLPRGVVALGPGRVELLGLLTCRKGRRWISSIET